MQVCAVLVKPFPLRYGASLSDVVKVERVLNPVEIMFLAHDWESFSQVLIPILRRSCRIEYQAPLSVVLLREHCAMD